MIVKKALEWGGIVAVIAVALGIIVSLALRIYDPGLAWVKPGRRSSGWPTAGQLLAGGRTQRTDRSSLYFAGHCRRQTIPSPSPTHRLLRPAIVNLLGA